MKETELLQERATLERRAGLVRFRLLRALDTLTCRRHRVADTLRAVKQIMLPAFAGAVFLVAAGAWLALHAVARRRRRLRPIAALLAPMLR